MGTFHPGITPEGSVQRSPGSNPTSARRVAAGRLGLTCQGLICKPWKSVARMCATCFNSGPELGKSGLFS